MTGPQGLIVPGGDSEFSEIDMNSLNDDEPLKLADFKSD